MPDCRRSILFFVGDAPFFVSHRLNLVEGAVAEGYRVVIACPEHPHAVDTICSKGAEWCDWRFSRGNTSIIGELRSLLQTFRIVRQTRPTLIHAIALKCILHAGLVSKVLNIPMVAAVSGLGYIYTGSGKGMRRMLRYAVNAVLNIALNRNNVSIIFQNGEDAHMVDFAGLDRVNVWHIGGSGVDLSKITMQPHPHTKAVRIGLPARLLRDKGVYEFVAAARELRRRGRNATFLLIGDPDLSNPTSVTSNEIAGWLAEGVIDWIAHTPDVGKVLATLHIVALPSYREGFPKTLIDAAAAGRAAVTTDVPGCRDAIIDGITGLLCPPADALGLADAIDRLVLDPELCERMGSSARAHAEAHFGLGEVTRIHLEIYEQRMSRSAL